MTQLRYTLTLGATALKRFAKNETGATLLEFTLVLPLFLLIIFAIIDFGRMGGDYMIAQKAVERAARIAAVRPDACVIGDLPVAHTRAPQDPSDPNPPARFGTSCSDGGGGVCADPGTLTCTGDLANATVNEIWTFISPVLPLNAQPSNLRFTYEFDQNLGFLGGPYVPVVTVELENLDFVFVTPLGGLAGFAANRASALPNANDTIPFPSMSASLPAEDLSLGTDG